MIARHLRELGCEYSIMRDKEFIECRKALDGKAMNLREKWGKGRTRQMQISERSCGTQVFLN